MFIFGLVRYGAFTLVSLSFLTLMVLLAGYLLYPDGYLDPFAPYDDFVPGRSAVSLAGYPCSTEIPLSSYDPSTCRIPLESKNFSAVYVTIQHSKITQIAFFGGEMRAADVVWHWGQPHMIDRGRFTTILRWKNGLSAVVPGKGRNLYGQPVELVQFALTGGIVH